MANARARPHERTTLWAAALRIEPDGFALSEGFRYALGVGAALAIGTAFWLPDTAVVAAAEPWLHALRLAVAAAYLLARRFKGQRGYWIVLTVIVVLKPASETTLLRVTGRWLGTLAGVVPVSVVATLAHPRGIALAIGAGLAAWAAYAVFQANYALYCVFLSAFVVLLLDVVKTTPSAAAVDRALDTTLGAILALLIFLATRPLDRAQPPAIKQRM